MKSFAVASGIVVDGSTLLMVRNRRRGDRVDWSTPGGVVDDGETELEALSREVVEETGIRVPIWSGLLYAVEASFVDLSVEMAVSVYGAATFAGSVRVEDPDGIVVEARFVEFEDLVPLLRGSPRWVAEPLLGHVFEHIAPKVHGQGPSAAGVATVGASSDQDSPIWRYRIYGTSTMFRVHREPDS